MQNRETAKFEFELFDKSEEAATMQTYRFVFLP